LDLFGRAMRTEMAFIAALLTSCAAPGSAIGRVAFSGIVVSGGSAAPVSLEATLPKHYGLGGLDLVMNTPEDFGHKDQTVTIEVKDGAFSFQFPPIVYHVAFWLLPPLGAFPKQPPEPAYFVRFSDTPEEIYLVGLDRGTFRYQVFSRSSRQELKHEEATWRFTRGDYVPVKDADGKVWHLRVEAARSNKAFNPTATPPLRSGAATG
jgi:hypothetical protein